MHRQSVLEALRWLGILLALQIVCLCWLKSIGVDTASYRVLFIPVWLFCSVLLGYSRMQRGDFLLAAALCLLVQVAALYIAVSQSDAPEAVTAQLIIAAAALLLALIFTLLLPKVLSFANLHRLSGLLVCAAADLLIWAALMATGGTAWLGGSSLQLTELMKLTAILFYALLYLPPDGKLAAGPRAVFVWGLGYLLYNAVLLVSLNEYGTLAVIALIYLSLQFVFDPALRHTLVTVGAGAGGMAVVAAAALLLPKQDGRLAVLLTQALKLDKIGSRLNIFLHPEADIYGSGYQSHQAAQGVAYGGMFGSQSRVYIPVGSSDFAFAELCHQAGSLIGILYLLLVLILVLRMAMLPSKWQLQRAWFVGSAALLGWQTYIACAGATLLLPIMGNPAIFISQGGSFLTLTLALTLSTVYGSTEAARERSRQWKRKKVTRQQSENGQSANE